MSSQGSKVIHSTSKVFWRTKLTLDIQIVNHPVFSTLEVIVFDSHKNIEYPRLYVNATMLKEHVILNPEYPGLLEERRDWMQQNDVKNEFGDVQKAVVLQLSNQYILSHIDTRIDGDNHDHVSVIMHHSYNESESVVREKPIHLVPYHITAHEMVSTYKDFRDVLSHVEEDFAACELNTSRADNYEHKASDHISGSHNVDTDRRVSTSTHEHETVRNRRQVLHKMSLMDHKVARLRWLHAIHKVIMHNKVQAIRRRLIKMKQENPYKHPSHARRVSAERQIEKDVAEFKRHDDEDEGRPHSVFSSIEFPYSNHHEFRK